MFGDSAAGLTAEDVLKPGLSTAFVAKAQEVLQRILDTLLEPMTIGIAIGPLVGKQLGIFGSVWLSVEFGLTRLPADVSWQQLYGVSVLAGIGFTMSLFIASLAFTEPGTILGSNFSVVLGSFLSAVIGMSVLYYSRTKGQDSSTESSRAPSQS